MKMKRKMKLKMKTKMKMNMKVKMKIKIKMKMKVKMKINMNMSMCWVVLHTDFEKLLLCVLERSTAPRVKENDDTMTGPVVWYGMVIVIVR